MSWLTISKTCSSIAAGGVAAASSRPIARCAAAPLALGDQRVGRLLDAVVEEPVAPLLPQYQPGPRGLPKCRLQRRLAHALDEAKGR